jgi:hypothetical protein
VGCLLKFYKKRSRIGVPIINVVGNWDLREMVHDVSRRWRVVLWIETDLKSHSLMFFRMVFMTSRSSMRIMTCMVARQFEKILGAVMKGDLRSTVILILKKTGGYTLERKSRRSINWS